MLLRDGVSIGRSELSGGGAVVVGGVRIGDGAVIGANAVVTKDVPAGGRWVGSRLLPEVR